MRRLNLQALAPVALALLAVPAAAQNFSESFTFLKGVRERDAAAVQAMATRPNPAVLNARDTSSGEGALHILVRGRDLSWLGFLLSRGARPDLQSNDGTTPLILAAQLGWREGAEQLLARGANPNLGNSRGETPLIFAVQRRDLGMVRLLISQRANPNQTDNVAGYSAIDYARQDRRAAAILRELE
ncbi:MAG TPA: ankyrin repeat domain-containing protein [Allosphingosinicella sp.]|nr:ankyrin repeat domain-containing protein [Allosphingosinicella sp.]